MNFRILFIGLVLTVLTGCADFNFSAYNPLDDEHPITKNDVKENINRAIDLNTQLADIFTRAIPAEELKYNPAAFSLEDRQLINKARSRQTVSLKRAKNVIAAGHITERDMFFLWDLIADSYVDMKTVANKYTEFFSPSKMASFKLLEDEISAKGKEIEKEFSNLNDDNSNTVFNLIMEQVVLMNRLFMVSISK